MKAKDLFLDDLIALMMKPVKRGHRIKFRKLKDHYAAWDEELKLITLNRIYRDHLVQSFVHEKLHHLEIEEDNTPHACSSVVKDMTDRIMKKLTAKQCDHLFKEIAKHL